MKIPTICRYCGGKIIKSTTRALYPKGSEADLSVRQLQRLCRLLPRRKPNGESS